MLMSSCMVRVAIISLEQCTSQLIFMMALRHWGDLLPQLVGEDAYVVPWFCDQVPRV